MVPVCGAPLRLISTPRERGHDTRAQVSLDMSLCSLFSILPALRSWTHTYSNVLGVEAGMWGVFGWDLEHPTVKHTCNDPHTEQLVTESPVRQIKLLVRGGGDSVLGKIFSQGKTLKQPEAFLLQFSASGPSARR